MGIKPSAPANLAIRSCVSILEMTGRIALGLRHRMSDYRHLNRVCSASSDKYRAQGRAKQFLRAGTNFARTLLWPIKLMAFCSSVRKGRRHVFSSERQKKMPSPTAHTKRRAEAIEKLQPGLVVEEIRTQGEALANHRVEKLFRFCVRLMTCPSRQGALKPC